LLVAGIAAFTVAAGAYLIYAATHPGYYTLYPVDLRVYRDGGLIVRHISPTYEPWLKSSLYDWPDRSTTALKFTYTPWAAIVFATVSFIPWIVLPVLSVAVNIAAVVAIVWFTLGALGYAGRVRLGATLLGAAAVFWTEPLLRTMFLGQVNLVLTAVIIWDLCQPGTRRWKGAATGFAAGIKLVPLIFIPYLVLTRRFREAAVASAAFVLSMVAGFVILPVDSSRWWLGGLFHDGRRTGFPGWGGNQSLRGLITRLAGSVHSGAVAWLLVAAVVGVAGLVAAALLDRNGHSVPGLLMAALTGLLVSPVSWDHHWVWMAPGVVVSGHYAVTAWQTGLKRRALAFAGLASGLLAVYWSWPGTLWSLPMGPGGFTSGVIWTAPESRVSYYTAYGDRRWFDEYHWHGLYLLAGNAYVLAGLAVFVAGIYAAARTPEVRRLLSRIASASG
jgi:alpha-1,2-mannosyltransferase